MVTAYFARSCWISTRSSVLVGVLISENLAPFHYKIDLFCNTNVGEGVTRYRNHVGEVALGEPAEVGLVDQVGGNDRRGAEYRVGGHAPVDQGDELVGVPAVGNGGGAAAAGALHPRPTGPP